MFRIKNSEQSVLLAHVIRFTNAPSVCSLAEKEGERKKKKKKKETEEMEERGRI